jgi:putative transposase
VEPESPNVPLIRQCKLFDLSRSSFYYEPEGESVFKLLLVLLMKAFLWTPGYEVNSKRAGRRMRFMGLAAIYPKPRLS